MANIFITGGAGFIGSHTVDCCVAGGHTVTVYDIKPWAEATNLHECERSLTYVEGDILDIAHLEKSMPGHSHVLHLAAVVSVPRTIEDPVHSHAVNVTGTLNVFECARRAGVPRVVYASSAAVYGAQETVPIREDAILSPQSPYGAHKAMNEMYAHQYTELYGLSTFGLRYFNVYGTRQDPHSSYSGVISIFCEKVEKGEPVTIFGDGSSTRDFVSVHDVAHANIKALMMNQSSVCNIGFGVEISLNELVELIERVEGKTVTRDYKSARIGDIARSCALIERAHTLLDFIPHDSLEDGLRRMPTKHKRI
jgi:UDP-glucose 4-epimerase